MVTVIRTVGNLNADFKQTRAECELLAFVLMCNHIMSFMLDVGVMSPVLLQSRMDFVTNAALFPLILLTRQSFLEDKVTELLWKI